MTAAVYTVRVRHPLTFQLVAELDQWESLSFKRRWQHPGEFELVIGNEHPLIDDITRRNAVIEVLRDGRQEFVGRVRQLSIALDDTDEGGFVWTLRGPDLADLIRLMRAVPPVGQEFDTQTNVSASVAMRYYVDKNAGQNAPTGRRYPFLDVGLTYLPGAWNRPGSETWIPVDPAAVGALLTVNARYERLGELITDLAVAGDVGYRFRLDPSIPRVYFDVYDGADRVEGSTTYQPAIFSLNRDTLRQFEYADNGVDVVNVVYAGGAGTGAARVVQEVQHAASVAQWGRAESFEDFRQATTTEALTTEAQRFLVQRADLQTVAFQPLETAGLAYLDGWDVGDKVTVRVDDLGIRADLRVIEVGVTLTPDAPEELAITVGAFKRDLLRHLRDRERETRPVRAAGYVPPRGAAITNPSTQGALTISGSSVADAA